MVVPLLTSGNWMITSMVRKMNKFHKDASDIFPLMKNMKFYGTDSSYNGFSSYFGFSSSPFQNPVKEYALRLNAPESIKPLPTKNLDRI